MRSWCTWHGSNGTCVEHRPCDTCGKPPVLVTADHRRFCIEHAAWNVQAQRWEPRPVK